MQKLRITRLSLAVMCALPLAAGAQQGFQLRSQPTLILIPPTPKEDLPLFIEADRLQGHQDQEVEAAGGARLRQRGQAVHADRLRYDKPSNEVEAEGNVRMELGSDLIEGARLQYNLHSDRGSMEQSSFTLRKPGEIEGQRQLFRETDTRGTAERILFDGPSQYRAQNAHYTSCGPGDDAWYLRARDLAIDKDRDVGVAHDASIVFMEVPIFYSPYLSFSLHQGRKSGFITPHYGSTNTGGTEFTVPYYWNIAPNRDYTLSPRVMTRRGVQANNEFRYLDPTYSGESLAEILPDDRARNGEQRWAYNVKHRQTLPNGWNGTLNLQKVSDDTYFTDLSTQITSTSQVLVPQEGTIGRVGNWAGGAGSYGLSLMAQRWQTLQPDPLAPVTPPYNRLPQLTLNAGRQEVWHSDFDFYGQYVAFEHPTQVNGQRSVAYPSVSLPLQTPYAYVTPKLGVTVTNYSVSQNTAGYTNETRTLPVFSTDTGMVFERPTTFGGAPFLQTLEPRLYYVYIPYYDQSSIPVFDSAQQDINFTTIYSENQFSSWDRINDANQLTLGATSRFLGADNGAEYVRAGLAQRYYFSTQRVTLPGVAPRTSNNSDLLAALSGNIAPHWTANAGWQYSTNVSQTQKFNIGTRYQPKPGSVFNASYRENISTPLRQTDFSAQWPVFGGWTGVARYNYSLQETRLLEGLIGAEYNANCWALRVVAHRFAVTTQQQSTTFFLQLELNGVSRIGSNPMDALRRNIGGYMRQDARTPLEPR
jgi:LPS-assembly protein